jgi:hypothetical protein
MSRTHSCRLRRVRITRTSDLALPSEMDACKQLIRKYSTTRKEGEGQPKSPSVTSLEFESYALPA